MSLATSHLAPQSPITQGPGPLELPPVGGASRAEPEEALRKKNHLLALLAEAAGYVLSTHDPDELVRGVFLKIREHVGVDTYFNYMVNAAGDGMELASCHGVTEEVARKIHRLDFGQAICGTVALLRRPIIATDIQNGSDPKADLVRGFGIRAYACNPLMAGDRLLGTLSFASRNRDYFDEDELDFFRTISRYVEAATERIRLTAESEERAKRLAEAEDRLRLAVEATALGTWDYCTSSGRLECSWRASQMLGLSQESAVSYEDVLVRMHPDDRENTISSVRAAFNSSGNGLLDCECRVMVHDESVRWIAGKGQAFFGEIDGRSAVVRFVGTVRDVTDQKRLQEKLSQTAKLESVGLLAGGIAHDFNNLLTGIMGNSSLALELLGPQHEAAPLLQTAVKSSARAADLTRQLLAYAGRARSSVRPVNLSVAVREVTGLVRSSIPRHVELRLQLDDNLPNVRADATQLQQVIMNLIINGAEAVPPDRRGFVTVRTTLKRIDDSYIAQIVAGDELVPGEHVSLEVEDTGSGMDEATRACIFDPFFTTKAKGRGLGLSAILGIVRAHKGAIRLYSAIGKGTIFRVLLPPTTEAADREEDAAGDKVAGSGTVLVVDDDETARGVTAAVLTRYGYEVRTAENGRQAVDILLSGVPVDAAVLDLNMPVLSGEDALPLLTSIRPGLKVIICTGYGDSDTADAYAGGQVAGFIQKPYTAVALAREVQMAMSAVPRACRIDGAAAGS